MTKTKNESRITAAKRSLAQRQDIAGQAYRTVRDNPNASAAVASGVAAAALAGAGAFFYAKSRKENQAFEDDLTDLNEDAVRKARNR